MPTAMEMVARWESRERPLFKGRLIDFDGPPGPDGRLCCCAQGDVLRCVGVTDDELRSMEQAEADRRVAKELGIGLAHAILLRHVNDRSDGAPQAVLKASGLRTILGPHWRLVLAFWRHLDAITAEDAARAAAGAVRADWEGAAAGAATRELVGWSKLATPYFLRFFFADPAAWVSAHEHDRDPGIIEDVD